MHCEKAKAYQPCLFLYLKEGAIEKAFNMANFWHGHFVEFSVESLEFREESSQCCKIPQTNREFWVNKIKRNLERDQKNYQVLHDNGWQVIVVWECQLTPKRIEETMLRVELLLNEHFLALHQPKVVPYDFQETPAAMAAEEAQPYGQK